MRATKIVWIALLTFLLIIIQLTIDAEADQITLINGNRLDGEILLISGNTLRLLIEYVGEVEVDFDNVASLSTDKSVNIALTTGDFIVGRIESISGNRIIIASEAFGILEVERSQLKSVNDEGFAGMELAELEKAQEALAESEAALAKTKEDLDEKVKQVEDLSSPLSLWKGSVAVGAKLERGNSDSSEFNLDIMASREAPRDKLSLRLLLDYEETNGEADTNRIYSSTKLQVFQTDHRYIFGITTMEYDEFEDLDLRAQAFTGPGYYFIRNERTELFGEIGGGVVGEFVDDEEEVAEFVAYLHIGWRQKIFETSELIQDITFLPSLSNGGEFRLRSETALRTPIRERWALKLSILDDYDSEPESEDVSKNDLTLLSSLEYTF